jgi:hypothetical protein
MAVRYCGGNWPGLRGQRLMAEDIFPVCSPALMKGPKPLRRPEDLVHHTLLHTTVGREDWQLWLTAAGLPVSLALRRGLSFDQSAVALEAAMDLSSGRRRLLHRRAGGNRRYEEDCALPRSAPPLRGGGHGAVNFAPGYGATAKGW